MDNQGDKVTYEEALEDIDLFFRTLRMCYGAYYYFGGDGTFNAAKEAVITKLSANEKIDFMQLGQLLRHELHMLIDGHLQIGGECIAAQPNNKYLFHHCGKTFSKDENGYFVLIDGIRWYYDSCELNNPQIYPYLDESGALSYSPVLWSPETQIKKSDKLKMRNGNQEKELPIYWYETSPYSENSIHEDVCDVIEEQGLLYLSMRSFRNSRKDVVQRFISSAAKIKEADFVIFDIRSNGGGGDEPIRCWLNGNANGELPFPIVYSRRFSPLSLDQSSRKYGYNGINRCGGQFYQNTVPIIVLVDNNCGSSGESMLNTIKSFNNVLVIGSNSAGCQLCGNQRECFLPNTGMFFSFGSDIEFAFKIENIDCKGYAPDVWCNPQNALNCVLAMMEYYNVAPSEKIETFRQRIEEEAWKPN